MLRRSVKVAGALLALMVLFTGTPASGDSDLASEEGEQDVAQFVLANTLAAFTTELARALIGELKIEPPNLMFEAVDELALLLMLPSEPDPVRDELVQAAAEGWAMAADRRGEPAEPVYWVTHGVDEQRFARLLCLLVGSDPETFAELGRELGIEGEEVTRCGEEYERTLAIWTALLEPHRRDKRKRTRGGTIRIEYEDVPGFQDLRELVQKSGILEAVAGELLATLVLPRSILVRFQSCGEENARWLPAERRIVICWELLRAFERLAREDAATSTELLTDQK